MRVVLVGPPGSGKGTQGPVLADHLGVPHLSTGDLLRDEVDAGSDLGRRVAGLIERGDLVPDDLVVEVVVRSLDGGSDDDGARDGDGLETRNRGYVLDGFPRTVAQAELIEAEGSALPAPDLAVHLDIPDDVVRRRLAHRAAEEDRADDADDEVVGRRLDVYREETEPLLAHYRDQGALLTIDGTGPPDEVSARVIAALATHG